MHNILSLLILFQSHYSADYKLGQQVLSFIFAIDEVNRNPNLLPNVTLIPEIYDIRHDPRTTYERILSLLLAEQSNVINYECEREKNVLSVIGGPTEESSRQLATITSVYKIPQVRVFVILLCQLWLVRLEEKQIK